MSTALIANVLAAVATTIGTWSIWVVPRRWCFGWWLNAVAGAVWMGADILYHFWGGLPAGAFMLGLSLRNLTHVRVVSTTPPATTQHAQS